MLLLRARVPLAGGALLTLVSTACVSDDVAGRRAAMRRELTAFPVSPPALPADGPLDRRAVVDVVLAANPSVGAARAAIESALAEVDRRSALPDPRASLGVAPLTAVSAFAGGPGFGAQVGLAQRIVWPQKLGLSAGAALDEADAARGDLAATRLRLALVASSVYDEYWASTRAIDVQREIVQLARQNEATALTAYRAGRGSQQDPIQAEVERIHAEHRLHVLLNEQDVARAQLNTLMHRSAAAELPLPPESLNIVELARDEPEPTHPLVSVEQARVAGAEKRATLSRWEYLPDVEVSAAYSSMWSALPHQLMVGLAFDIPIQLGARDAKVEQMAARARMRESELARVADGVDQRRQVALSNAEHAAHVEELLGQQLLPAARQRAAAALAGFESGENEFDVVIAAERHRYDVELEYLRSRAALSQRRAELREAQGLLPITVEEVAP